MENIEIQVWTANEKLNRWKELVDIWLNFRRYEPLSSGIMDLEDAETREYAGYAFRDMLGYDSTPCVVAWDTLNNKAAGFVFSITQYSPEATPFELQSRCLRSFDKYPFGEGVLEKLSGVATFLHELFNKADVFSKLSVDKVFMIHVTSVLQEYTRRGLANEMTKKVLEVAKEAGFEYAVSESTSSYTQHNKIKRFGFEKIFEIDFESNYANYDMMPQSLKETHKSAAVLVKRL
ncbi:Dat [Bugula neritina]|uniref:Dat n=1 Tax=Bugula neritina TaxID=10212 RepID=A0A7J7KGA2_BUGNE|nr:Dat [Bugula neritina]